MAYFEHSIGCKEGWKRIEIADETLARELQNAYREADLMRLQARDPQERKRWTGRMRRIVEKARKQC